MRTTITWVLSILLAIAFLVASFVKITAQPVMVQGFTAFGFPVWFLYVTGFIELAGAILVLLPLFAGIGAALLSCVMVGAIFTHLTHGQAAQAVVPLILLALALTVGWLRGWSRSTLVAARA
jgi:putative oxidoreductase